jgi:hypothetical protein
MRAKRSIRDGCGLAAVLLLLALAMPLAAQEQEAPAEDAQAADVLADAGATETIVVDNEVMALVAPIALYPDPLLAVILQASMFPVDVVQADRFLQRYQEDQTLEPSTEWDPSLIALLNYPTVLTEMNDHLDWTEAMGDAVYEELEAVQDAVQDVRHGAYAMGVLASNEVQEVVIEEGVVQIRPTTENLVAVPDYDGAALLAALQPVEQAPAAATPAAEQPADAAEADTTAADDLAQREAALAQREAEVAEREADVADREEAEAAAVEAGDEETYAEPSTEYAEPETAYVETAAVDPYASSYAPAQPSYVQPPVYAAPPPPVSYSEPSSGWGTAATFIGGAAVGGLLGYAIFDDDDNNNGGNKTDKSINIEDSTIVVGGSGDRLNLDKDERKRINKELKDRRDRSEGIERRDRRDRNRQVAALPDRDRRDANRNRDRGRDISLPQRDRQRDTKVERRQDRAKPALQAPKQKKGAVADVKRPSQTKKEASRGKQSRAKATVKRGQAPQRQVAQRGGGGGGKKALGASKGGKQKAKAKSNRGKKSRGKRRG